MNINIYKYNVYYTSIKGLDFFILFKNTNIDSKVRFGST